METNYNDEYLIALIYLYILSGGVKLSIEEEKLEDYRRALTNGLKIKYNEDLPENCINYEYKFYFTTLDDNKNKVCVLNAGNSLSTVYKVLINHKSRNYINSSLLPDVLENIGIYEKDDNIHDVAVNNIKI